MIVSFLEYFRPLTLGYMYMGEPSGVHLKIFSDILHFRALSALWLYCMYRSEKNQNNINIRHLYNICTVPYTQLCITSSLTYKKLLKLYSQAAYIGAHEHYTEYIPAGYPFTNTLVKRDNCGQNALCIRAYIPGGIQTHDL